MWTWAGIIQGLGAKGQSTRFEAWVYWEEAMPHRPPPFETAGPGGSLSPRGAGGGRAQGGRPVRLTGNEAFTMLAAEVVDDAAIARMRRARAFLVLSHSAGAYP